MNHYQPNKYTPIKQSSEVADSFIGRLYHIEKGHMTSTVSDATCLLVAGSMLMAVAWHAGRKGPPTGVLPGEPWGALLAELAGESRGAGAGLHPRGVRAVELVGDSG